MVIGIVLLVLVGVLVVAAARRRATPGRPHPVDAHSVRRFFQYLVLYGLVVVVAVGLSGLLGRLLGGGEVLVQDDVGLARDLAFSVVGVPLLVAVALWSRRRLTQTPAEAASGAWSFYVIAVSLTSLVMAMTGLHGVLSWVVGLESYDGGAIGRLLVWGGAWVVHMMFDARLVPPANARLHHLAGSLVGLVTAVTGLAGAVGGAVRVFLGLDGGAALAGAGSPVHEGLVLLAVGAPVWVVYWLRRSSREERDTVWLAYVLLAGVAGGLVTAITSASLVAYSVLVWLVGEPRTTSAAEHFQSTPTALAAALVGVLVWWYHQAVLAEGRTGPRTEVRRVYEYLMAGIGLGAAAVGLIVMMMALVEALTGSAELVLGPSAVNTILAAATLLAVGAPVWWFYWSRLQRASRSAPDVELRSPSRRAYLVVLFGIGGVAAVVALLVGVYLLFEDVVQGDFGLETLRSMRVPIGVLVATAAVAWYHGAVYRADHEAAPATVEERGPRFVLLVGPADAEIAHAVARRTHGHVQAWTRTDDGQGAWSVDAVEAVLDGVDADEVIVLSEHGRLRVIPVRRR